MSSCFVFSKACKVKWETGLKYRSLINSVYSFIVFFYHNQAITHQSMENHLRESFENDVDACRLA